MHIPVRIVLVDTSHPGNIGATARAMKTMGLTELALVRPKYFPHDDATARSAGAIDILAAARVYETLAGAIADCGWVVGASARLRTIALPIVDPREAAATIWQRLAPGLEERGVLTAWDVDAFVVLCEALARYRSATQLVYGSALLVQGGAGLMKNPALQVQAEAERTFLQFAARFGLTPSDRQSIKVEVGREGNKGGADRLLS